MVRRSADGSGEDEPLADGGNAEMPADWSPDGRTLISHRQTSNDRVEIWTISPGLVEPKPFMSSKHTQEWARLSPDGRWLSYMSTESGRPQVYVGSLDGKQRLQVSADGASHSAWSPDGRRLYYRGLPGRPGSAAILAVDVATEPRIALSKPRTLFLNPGFAYSFDVSPDGRHFVMMPDTTPLNRQVNLVQNWFRQSR